MTAKITIEDARQVLRADYLDDVSAVADEFCQMWRDGDFDSADEAERWLDETLDGHGRVIYVASAQECLRFSDSSDAYVDEYGKDGLVTESRGINWSGLARAAFRQDVLDAIEAEGVDPNDDPPEKVMGHEHVFVEDEQLEAIEEAVGECEGDYPCAHRDEDGEFDCGKPKRLHGRK